MSKNQVLLFNPQSAKWKHRVPNSILQVGASIYGKYDLIFIDGNLEADPWEKIKSYLTQGNVSYIGLTVMPGPQLKQAIPISKKIKLEFPETTVIWGGYFASNQYEVVLKSGYIDYVVDGAGDNSFPDLLDSLEKGEDPSKVKNLIFIKDGNIITTAKEALLDQDTLPQLPYSYFDSFYPIRNYLQKTFMGKKTMAYHSSMGCPFTCSFCAVVPIYKARWKGKSAENIYKDVKWLIENYGVDAIEFHDNNFFTSRKRVVEFSKLVLNDNIKWWGEGRIDTINNYSDEDLQLMKDAGCEMIFFGAETGSDEVLKQMDKGGTQSATQIKEFAVRLKKFGIIPEYSFVLGMPGESEEKVMTQINEDIEFIKEIKELNPDTEIIIYLYSPVPSEGTELYKQITKAGFEFPEKIEDWLNPSWENFDLRKNPLTPWLTPEMVSKIQDFETVLNGYHPTQSDYRIRGIKKRILQGVSKWRYKNGFYKFPYEIKALHKVWKYRQPEIEGFYGE
ncbi:MAG: radical SAM protein [Vicingaceae bacterium]